MDTHENQVLEGPCLDVLRELPDGAFDAVVMDPPYGLGKEPTVAQLVAFLQGADLITGDFMGAKWDIPSVPVWREIYRVLKPGGHVLSFGGTRAWDLISLGARAAGFEFRDTIADVHPALMMVHGMGFPKSLNVSKKIDQLAGAEREVIGTYRVGGNALTPTSEKGGTYVTGAPNSPPGDLEITAPATPEAKQFGGYGTALKPSWEPILVFRKPLEGTVVENVLEHGTGAINIDATRVAGEPWKWGTQTDIRGGGFGSKRPSDGHVFAKNVESDPKGRWPSNFVLVHAPGCKQVGTKKVKGARVDTRPEGDGGREDKTRWRIRPTDATRRGYNDEDGTETVEAWECVKGCPIRELDEQSGECGGNIGTQGPRCEGSTWSNTAKIGGGSRFKNDGREFGDSGGASRFFPSFPGQEPVDAPFQYTTKATKRDSTLDGQIENNHPTKKPLGLMKWLVRLVCPKDGIVLDPYCGSGTTLHAAAEEGMRFTGIDRDPEWAATARARMKLVLAEVEADQGQRDIFAMMWEGLGDDEG